MSHGHCTAEITSEIAVIIPVYNDGDRLELCLNALQQQTLAPHRFHIVAVDNGSETPPTHLEGRYPNFTLLHESKPGSYSARNKALSFIKADIYAFTDADCIPEPQWLEHALAGLVHSSIDAVGGAVGIFCADPKQPQPIEILDVIKAFPQRTYVETQHYAVTANLVMTQHAFDMTGWFNDALKSGGDKEWCRRLHAAGGQLIYSDTAKVLHPARASLAEHETKARRVAHGAYARRKTDPNTAKFVGWSGILMGLMPPIRKGQVIWQRFAELSASTRIKAIGYYYYVNAYAAWQKIRCHLGLVKHAERS
ncbi:glycosyltransferase [Echinimonas agarilytica]|uniref:Glycosyltransferase family 2 protein n=1 Tax=Echinimonas agarilytica TaxID=1215918 RepID=A0AA41W8X5_9GAMM|nr:glycosyltransferase [Echinimonas agarilytica]MCM2681492.1 glycosyltransferase family 2 protein [Echinimonas agarilytica]